MSDKLATATGIENISLTTKGMFQEKYARGFAAMKPDTVQMILDKNIPRGDLIATAPP